MTTTFGQASFGFEETPEIKAHYGTGTLLEFVSKHNTVQILGNTKDAAQLADRLEIAARHLRRLDLAGHDHFDYENWSGVCQFPDCDFVRETL